MGLKQESEQAQSGYLGNFMGGAASQATENVAGATETATQMAAAAKEKMMGMMGGFSFGMGGQAQNEEISQDHARKMNYDDDEDEWKAAKTKIEQTNIQ